VRAGVLTQIRRLIQEDVGGRGLATVPGDNLLTARPDDLTRACRSIATRKWPRVCVVTGFYIPHASPPAGETDGPLGALFLARALVPHRIRVVLATDPFCLDALRAGLAACGLAADVPVLELAPGDAGIAAQDYCRAFAARTGPITHLVALERVGPSHTPWSMVDQRDSTLEDREQFRQEVSDEHHDRCHTMRGLDITAHVRPAHLLFGPVRWGVNGFKTIGIGDGGNEIGMGRLPWRVIRQNIPRGGLVACRVATDYLIVCGVSNWGAYGLAAGVLHLRGVAPPADLFDVGRERELLRVMVERGPLVDGVSGQPSVTVDGLPFDRYAEPLRRLPGILAQ
jgi:hypothetical protein